jgi:hypothetical protein
MAGFYRYTATMKTEIPPELADNPLLLEMMRDALAMQDRFAAEPVYSKTGTGYLKSAGVAELQKIKKETEQRKSGND